MLNTQEALALFEKWARKLRITPGWDIRLEFVEDAAWRKTGDIKIDCDDRKAVVLINAINPKSENIEEVMVHELLHLKMYPLDQVTESLIMAHYEKDTPASNFAYTQFFTALEQTVEELTKCMLIEFGADRELSYGRCQTQSAFHDLYDGLRDLK